MVIEFTLCEFCGYSGFILYRESLLYIAIQYIICYVELFLFGVGEGVGLSVRILIVGCFLILLSMGLYFFGSSVTDQYLNPSDPLFGSYLVIFSVFLGIAGFLILVSQVFPGRSILT